MQDAPDDEILDRAHIEDRVIVSHDTDFGTLLAVRRQSKPSFVLVRSADPHTDQVARLIIDNLDVMAADLAAGAIATLARGRLRSRRLPLRSPAVGPRVHVFRTVGLLGRVRGPDAE